MYNSTWFNDIDSLSTQSKPNNILLRGGNRLDGLTLTGTQGQNYTHGGAGGDPVELALKDDEYWTQTTLCQGKRNDHTRIFYLHLTTSAGNELEVGTQTDDCQAFKAPEGWQVVGFYGRDGDEVDRLGFIYGLQ